MSRSCEVVRRDPRVCLVIDAVSTRYLENFFVLKDPGGAGALGRAHPGFAARQNAVPCTDHRNDLRRLACATRPAHGAAFRSDRLNVDAAAILLWVQMVQSRQARVFWSGRLAEEHPASSCTWNGAERGSRPRARSTDRGADRVGQKGMTAVENASVMFRASLSCLRWLAACRLPAHHAMTAHAMPTKDRPRA